MIDPHWDSVSLAAPMEGEDGSTTFIDLKGKTLTPNGNVKISTYRSKSGNASSYFDGSGDYLSHVSHVDFGFGTGDYTIECWIYISGSQGADRAITDFRSTGGSDVGTFFINTDNKLAFWYGSLLGGNGAILSIDTWYHAALARQSGVTRCFLNGVLEWSSSATVNFGTSRPLGIGGSVASGLVGTSPFNGYIDDLRITKGVARYTANFTPPASLYFSADGEVYFPAELVESSGIVPVVGNGYIYSQISALLGGDNAIIATGEIYSWLDSISSSGTSEALPSANKGLIDQLTDTLYGHGITSIVGFGLVRSKKDVVSLCGISGEWVGRSAISSNAEVIYSSGRSHIIGIGGLTHLPMDMVDGQGVVPIVGTGKIVDNYPVVMARGKMFSIGTAALHGKVGLLSSTGKAAIKGVGTAKDQLHIVDGRRHEKIALANFRFIRGSLHRGTYPSLPINPIHFTR